MPLITREEALGSKNTVSFKNLTRKLLLWSKFTSSDTFSSAPGRLSKIVAILVSLMNTDMVSEGDKLKKVVATKANLFW